MKLIEFVIQNFDRFEHAKGQLISKGNSTVFTCTKNQTKIFFYFCPEDTLFQNGTFVGSSPTQGNIFYVQFILLNF